jgi:hypothetical protein
MLISVILNPDNARFNQVTIRTEEIASVAINASDVTICMNSGMCYTEHHPSSEEAETRYDYITLTMATDKLSQSQPVDPPEVTTCKELLKHLDLFPDCGDGEIIIQINDSRYELYDHPILIEGLQSTIHNLLEDLQS